jgi:hypothetical protein
MLERLDAIDWAMLSHAYGSAVDVPQMIRDLCSPDLDTRNHALSDLFSTIYHQGTVYSASAPAVPFLIELAAHPDTPDGLGVLYLLQALSAGTGYIEAHESIARDALARICAERGSDLETERQREQNWVQAAHDAVTAGLSVYCDLLADEDPALRSFTLYLLASLPEHASIITPLLRPMLVEEREPLVALSLAVALRTLAGTNAQELAVFERVLCEAADPVLRLVAAVALVERLGDAASEDAIEVLVASTRLMQTDETSLNRPMEDTWSIARGYLPEPWGESLLDLVIAAFSQLPLTQQAHQLLRALSHAAAPDVAHELAKVLLDRVFDVPRGDWLWAGYSMGRDGRPRIAYHIAEPVALRSAQNLAALQHGVISAITHCDAFWQIDTNLLERHGLPGDRVSLRTWRRQITSAKM